MARLTPFEVGQIKAHLYHGMGPAAMASIVKKADGQFVSKQAVCNVINKLEADPKWRGERAVGSGRYKKTSRILDKRIVKEVFARRGRRKVTVGYLKKKFVALRSLSDGLVESRLHDAGLEYLRRRRKSLVPKKHRRARIFFARGVKRKRAATLRRWAFTDGASWYLDRDDADVESTQRAALGRMVWRRTDRKDALYADCVGPSSYKKAQGPAVRIWGMLAEGRLHVTILPAGVVMNRWWYAWVIKKYFPLWLYGCDRLVQDYERCLRCEEPLLELSKLGVQLVDGYPKCSQDLNGIENAWNLVRERLAQTLPTSWESRDAFVSRLRAAIRWVNINCQSQLWKFCSNQKERADEVLLRKGGRTSW